MEKPCRELQMSTRCRPWKKMSGDAMRRHHLGTMTFWTRHLADAEIFCRVSEIFDLLVMLQSVEFKLSTQYSAARWRHLSLFDEFTFSQLVSWSYFSYRLCLSDEYVHSKRFTHYRLKVKYHSYWSGFFFPIASNPVSNQSQFSVLCCVQFVLLWKRPCHDLGWYVCVCLCLRIICSPVKNK